MTTITINRVVLEKALEAFLSGELRPYEAAKTSAALRTALDQQMEPVATLTAQRDALLEKIKAVIAAEQSEGSGCGGFIKRPPTREYQRRAIQAWQELHAAIKEVEGEK